MSYLVGPSGAQSLTENDFVAKGDLLTATAAAALSVETVGADGFILTADSGNANGIRWTSMAASLPVVDSTSLVEGSGDDTKEMRIEVDGLTTATTRVATMPDADITLGTDADAIHNNVASEISAIAAKATPVAADLLLLEDSAAANAKKSITMGDIDHDALANFDIGEHRIINDAGTSTTELWSSSKISSEVSAAVANLDFKDTVQTVATSNITLSGEQTLNGFLTSASRVGVTAQTDKTENGIYTSAAGAWTRTADADADAEVTQGMTFFVSETTSTKKGFQYIVFTPNPITVGSTGIEFIEVKRVEFGTTAGTATEGDDSRVLTQDENDAAVGTNGTPSTANKFVTNSDPRNTDNRTDATSIHDNVAAEISAISEKVTPVNADLVIIEDSADSNNKKKVQVGNLPYLPGNWSLAGSGNVSIADSATADVATTTISDGDLLHPLVIMRNPTGVTNVDDARVQSSGDVQFWLRSTSTAREWFIRIKNLTGATRTFDFALFKLTL